MAASATRAEGVAGVSRGAVRTAMGHLGVGCLATWPMVEAPASRLIGHPFVDVWNHAWGAWWFWDSLSQGALPLHTRLLGAPSGGYLWYIDPIGALATAPLVPVLGVVAAWNVLVLAYVTLASVAGRGLALALGASATSSWVGAVATAVSPYLLSEIHNGISEAVGVCWSVFALAALARAGAADGRRRDWAMAGLWGGLTAVGTVYYALGLALAALPLALHAAWRRPREGTLGILTAALVAAAIAVPTFLLVRITLGDPAGALIGRPDAPLSNPAIFGILAHNAVDPRSFFVPGEFQSVDVSRYGEFFLHTSYVGWVALCLALWGRRWLVLGAATLPLVFSLGPFLYYDGDFVRHGARLVDLPYRLLFEVLPTSALGHPQRAGFPGLALLYGLAAATLARARPPVVSILALAVAGEALLLSPAAWPIARTAPWDDASAVHVREAVARQPDRAGIVLDLPGDVPGSGMTTSRYLLLQATHGLPLPYSPDVRVAACKLQDTSARALLQRLPSADRVVTAASLHAAGVRWVVLHGDLADVSTEERVLTPVLGEPERFGEVAVYPVTLSDPGGP